MSPGSTADGGERPAPASPPSEPNRGPLAGVRVLDLTKLYPGPLATMLLADMGAEVIKVERPCHPDEMRQYPPFLGGESLGFLAVNRGKRSLFLDWRKAEGRKLMLQLAARCDAVVEQFRPGVLAAAGLGFSQLKKVRSDMVLVSLTGYGQVGPMANKAGHDLNYMALSGLLHASTPRGQEPAPLGVQFADIAAGAYMLVSGVVAALFQAKQSGKGAHVDLAMTDGCLPLLTLQWAHFQAVQHGGTAVPPILAGVLACYAVYVCADGKYVALAALEPKFWRGFCLALDRPRWAELSLMDLAEAGIKREVGALFAAYPQAYWVQFAAGGDYCLTPVLAMDELVAHPYHQVRSNFPTVLQPLHASGEAAVRWPASPMRFSSQEKPPAAPLPGAHSRSILAELGVEKHHLKRLADEGIVHFGADDGTDFDD